MQTSLLRQSILSMLVATTALFVFAAIGVSAEHDDLVSYYDRLVEGEIDQMDYAASATPSDSYEGRCEADLLRARADFYRRYKGRLVEQLVQMGERKLTLIDVTNFLAVAFYETGPRMHIATCRIGGSGHL